MRHTTPQTEHKRGPRCTRFVAFWGGIRRRLGDVSCLNHRLLEGPFLTDEGVWQSCEAGSSPGSQTGRGEKPRHNAVEGP
jgi:hypothetical protein